MNQADVISKVLKVGTTPIMELGGSKISVLSLLSVIFILFFLNWLSKNCERLVDRFLEPKDVDKGVKGMISRLTRYFVLASGIMIALDTLGIRLSSLAGIAAVLMVGIGFGLQNVTQNFISGLIILFERPIKVGDLVQVKDVSGRVDQIGARSTTIHTRDDVAIIVPNSQFISEQVINESFTGDTKRLSVNVGVSYSSDVKKVKECLLEVAKGDKRILQNPLPKVFFENFGDSSLDFELCIWITDNWDYKDILSEARFRIDEIFRREEISIPFPQRDVHLNMLNKNISI